MTYKEYINMELVIIARELHFNAQLMKNTTDEYYEIRIAAERLNLLKSRSTLLKHYSSRYKKINN